VKRSPSLTWCIQALLVLTLAWGALAFGAVYPWAYQPLVCGALVVGLAALLVHRHAGRRLEGAGWLALAFGLFAAAAAVQLVPLPFHALDAASPNTGAVLRTMNLGVANHAVEGHALSIAPAKTAMAIGLFGAFALLVLGAARLFALRGPAGTAEALAAFGVVLAIVGFVQKPLFGAEIYGFWTPIHGRNPFGPFVNKNHFAGWMLMALPVTLGLFCAGVARGMEGVKPSLRDRVIWFSSPAANRLILLGAAAAVMALSLVLTMSRSGITAMTLAVTMTAMVALRRQQTHARRRLVTAYLVVLFVAVFGWAGVDAVVTRFSEADWSEFNNRRGAWSDAWAIASRFPLAGTGLNTYGTATVLYQSHDLTRHYVEAHSDYLQLAAEGGVLLAAPALLALAAFAALVRRRFREETSLTSYWLRVGAITGLAAIALQETVEFSLQMPGNAALFAVVCALAIHETPRRNRNEQVVGRTAHPR
jgi:O-antigen ligase